MVMASGCCRGSWHAQPSKLHHQRHWTSIDASSTPPHRPTAAMLAFRGIRTASPVLRQVAARRYASGGSNLSGAADNAFNRERQAVKEHAAGTADLWRKLAIYVTIPALLIAGVNAWRLWDEHWEHKSHEPPVSERTEYPYMNIRTKNFFWGDGDKTLFWNDKVNAHNKPEGAE